MGANAFAHESGIHQDGMLKNKSTYEIITPEEIGLVRSDEAGIVMGEPHAIKFGNASATLSCHRCQLARRGSCSLCLMHLCMYTLVAE